MKKVAVVFWSGTGNTEAMAKAVVEGAKDKGAEVTLFDSDAFDDFDIDAFDAVGFGCPAMGAEELEEDEFQPMFDGCKDKLDGKNIALFGSYGWGDGEWMETWADDCKSSGAVLVCDSVICMEEPDDDALDECKALGASLAE